MVIDLRTGKETVQAPRLVLGLGNFDGVHVAHAEILRCVKKMCSKLQDSDEEIRSAAWCFRNPSSDYLSRAPIGHITTFEERVELFAQAGMDYVIVEDFESLRDMPYPAFISEKLIREYRTAGVVCGYNFRFGQKGEGQPRDLQARFDNVIVLPRRSVLGSTISSSRIRWLVRAGDMETATTVLGRPFSVTSEVVSGKHVGKTLSYPTVNQVFGENMLVPRRGVYVTTTRIDGQTYPSVTNVGFRPTLETSAHVNCETHILDFEEDLYGKIIKVSFLKRIRDEYKLADAAALSDAIREDVNNAKAYFSEHHM